MTPADILAKAANVRLASHAALQLVSLLDQPTVGNESLVNILKHDNVLTAKLLRACNSPYYGFDDPVASVDQAVFMLGHQQILQMVLTLEFSSTMVVPLPGYAVEARELWEHSLATAAAAEIIAAAELEIPGAEPAVAFTVGLLHDIGKLALNQVLTPECQVAIQARVGLDKLSLAEAEKEVLGTDHAEAGAALLEKWRLPAEIIEGVANHHHPSMRPRPGLSIVAHVADVVAHLAGSAPGWDSYAVRVENSVIEAFSLQPEVIESMVMRVRENFDQVNHLMNLA